MIIVNPYIIVPAGPQASSLSISEATGVYSLGYTYGGAGTENTKPPSIQSVEITGTMQIGQTLTATAQGFVSYNGKVATTHGYQWYRSIGKNQGSEAAISGATSSTYTLVTADFGYNIRCLVTPKEVGGTNDGVAISSKYTEVASGDVVIESITTTIKGLSTTSLRFDMPNERPDGDLYLLFIVKDDDPDFTSTDPVSDGWTLIQEGTGNAATYLRTLAYYKVGSSEPLEYGPYTIDSETYIAVVYRLSGQNATPLDTSAVTNHAPTTSPTAPSVTTTAANCLVFHAVGGSNDEASADPAAASPDQHVYFSIPATESINRATIENGESGAVALAISIGIQASAGATGTKTFSFEAATAPEEHVGITVAIAPD